MKFSLVFLSSLLATAVTGLAIPAPQPEPETTSLQEREAFAEALPEAEALATITSSTSDAEIIRIAALGWAASTKTVSAFIDAVASKKFKSQTAYVIAAKVAYFAEQAEWAFKEKLAEYLNNNQGCQAANSTLSDGDTWSNISDLLLELTELDWNEDQDQIQEIINQINFGDGTSQGRCGAILPAFDVYFTAASKLFRRLSPRNKALVGLRAVGSKSCSAVSSRDVLQASETMEA